MPSKRTDSRIEVTTHDSETRANIPTAELESLVGEDASAPETIKYRRKDRSDMEQEVYERDADLDPQLVWKGKDQEDSEPLSVDAAPIFVQEKIHPKTIIDDIRRRAKNNNLNNETPNLFEEWAGYTEPENKIKFYQHDLKWSNRLILGDSLQVMASLSSKEGLKGQVQCIFLDPPYGIRFNSNWQTSLKGSGGKNGDITREPEAIKAFRDTWKGGVNSYLSYLRDRLIVANDLLSESGAIFLQIGEQNVHRAKILLDEVFGHANCVATIPFVKTTSQTAKHLPVVCDYIVFYAKNIEKLKYRKLYKAKENTIFNGRMTDYGQQVRKTDVTDNMNAKPYKPDNLTSQSGGSTMNFSFTYRGINYPRRTRDWSTNEEGMNRLSKANRIHATVSGLQYVRYPDDFEYTGLANVWTDTTTGGFGLDKLYVVQTTEKVVARCMNMVTDPGDLVLDPTCGSGTTGIVAERFGRRWILIDTSRVAITVARQRLIGAHYPYFALKDSITEEEIKSEKFNIHKEIVGDISKGLHVRKAPNITLRSISTNAAIDEVDRKYENDIEFKLNELRGSISKDINVWDLPTLNIPEDDHASINCFNDLVHLLRSRQVEIDTAIREGAELVPLHDQPIEIIGISRVTGPFTVESLSPHRVLPTRCEDDYLYEAQEAAPPPPLNTIR